MQQFSENATYLFLACTQTVNYCDFSVE